MVPVDLEKVLEMCLAKQQRRWQNVNVEQVEIWQGRIHSGPWAIATTSSVRRM